MLIEFNINTILERSRNDFKVCYPGISYQDINRPSESIISIFVYMNIRILVYHIKDIIYQNNHNPQNLDTVLYTNSAMASAIAIVQYQL